MNPWHVTAHKINRLGCAGTPFLFAFDFGGNESFVYPLSQVDPATILYDIAGISNRSQPDTSLPHNISFVRHALCEQTYSNAFSKVMYHLRRGDSYLLNLTFPVEIETNLSSRTIFDHVQAPFKMWYNDRFVVFSPESFISISGHRIHTFPMKGTIKAGQEGAEQILLNNAKELAEHYTIVDLLRNDLSMVALQVRVERFRYVQPIETLNGQLLQTSSHISGQLSPDWPCRIGDILLKLLPAGSISGAPKQRTVEVIRESEMDDRGFYTGVMGLFDGKNLHSAVMIRFIETRADRMFFRAGGGITVNSTCREEYDELMQKVVLPIAKKTPGL
ncbi:MAG: aminodeoxychorismate synthase component I [Bacteroidetes bacterium]|nr:aminodeoxychorismate synthase component I [Bacteroidota bacterium]